MEFEDVLEKTGGFGKFQKKLTILFLIPIYCVIPWFWLNKIFMLSVPQHWCSVPELLSSNLSVEAQRALISPPSDPSCSMYNVSYAEILSNGFLYAPNDSDVIPCMAGWQYDTENYEETASTKWDMVCEYNYFPSLIFTLANVGSLISATIYGYLADKFGRKIVFLSLAGVIVVTEISSALTSNFKMFIALRTINGSCLPTMFTLPYILSLELVSPKVRTNINGIINTSWTFGLCLLPLVAYLSRHWTTLCYVTAGCGMLILTYSRFIPESPSWLLSRDKFEDAKKIMIKIGKENGNSENETEMLFRLKALRERIQKEKEDNSKKSESRHVIFRYPRLRRNFFILAFCWLTFNVTYGGLTYNMVNLHGNEFMNFFLICVVEFPGNLIFWYAMNNAGRRWTATLGLFLTGLFCLFPVIGFQNSDILSSMIGKFLITGCFMVTDQQGTELFPTAFRSSGMAAAKSISGALGLFVPFIAYLNMYGKSFPFIIISCVCLISSVLSSFLPESLNENLPQTISDAEKFGKDQKFFSLNNLNENLPQTISDAEKFGKDQKFFSLNNLNENLPQTISDAEKFGKDQKFFSLNKRTSDAKARHCPVLPIEVELEENM